MFHTVQYNTKFQTKTVLKASLLALLVIVGAVIPANAQTTSEFGYKLHPEKLLENTVGDLQIYVESNEIMVPKTIKNLKAVSSDTDIIEILEIQDDSTSFTKNLKIKAVSPGVATVVLAAQGFSSKEITLTVFNNNNHPTQIMMKVTPTEFSIDGPRYGHVGIQLATTGGLPTIANDDVIVKVETPNTDVIQLRNSELIINAGEYYGIMNFDVIGSGTAIIFADVEGMEKVSKTVEILEAEGPLEVQVTVIPKIFASFNNAEGYTIVQLVDAGGTPVIAEEDIVIELGVNNPQSGENTSNDFEEIKFDDKKLLIKKGEYSTFTKFSPIPNLGDFTDADFQDFEVFVSVENYRALGDSFTVIHDEIGALEGEGPSFTEMVPFLTTGNEEIIGVTYFETTTKVSRQYSGGERYETFATVPVMSKSDYEIKISSSDDNTVVIQNPIMKKGNNVALVFGNTGTMTIEEEVEIYITDNEGVKSVNAQPEGPIEDDISLIIDSLIPMILAGAEFPMVSYLNEAEEVVEGETTTEDEEEEVDPRLGPTKFVEDGILTFSANELVDIESTDVKKNQEYVINYPLVEDVGETELNGQIGPFEDTFQLKSYTTDPTTIEMGFIDNMLVNEESLGTVQLLDSVGDPVYAKKDRIIQLVSNDELVLKIPDQVTIKEGEYFNTFKLEPMSEGIVEVAILSQDLPLANYEVNILDISPVLSLNLGGTMNWNERIEAKLSVSIPKIEASLSGFQVEWEAEGGEVLTFDEVTNSQGIAVLNIVANELETVSISAVVSGNGLSSSTLSESVEIQNIPIIEESSGTAPIPEINTGSSTELPLDNTTIILIVIPVAIVGAIFFLKRTDRLDLITEKIPIGDKLNFGDKFEEIKEKVSDIRNR